MLRCQPHCFFWTVASNVQNRALYSPFYFQLSTRLLAIPPHQQPIQVPWYIVVCDNPHAPYLNNIANMHPFILVPLLASFTALYPVGAMPMEFSTPVNLPGVGDVKLGAITPSFIPNMDTPKAPGGLPVRRDLSDMGMKPVPTSAPPPPVIGFGHDPPVQQFTRMVKARHSLLDSPNAAPQRTRPPPRVQDAPTTSDSGPTSGLLSGLPAGGSTNTLPSGAAGGNSSPLGAGSSGPTSGLLSALPISQAGSATGPTSAFTPGTPETPDTPTTPVDEKDFRPETATVENNAAEKDLSEEENTIPTQETGATKGKAHTPNHESTFNPGPPDYHHSTSKEHKGPAPVQRRAMTTYHRVVNSRSMMDNKAHSVMLDTDPIVPPQDPGPDYDSRMGLVNVDSDSKPKPPTKEDSAKAPQVVTEAPKNATLPAH